MIKSYRPGQGGNRKNAHGDKAERKLAKRFNAQLTPASGAAHHGAKGDMVHGDFRTESKSTVKDSFSIRYETLCKIAQEAAEQNQRPTLTIQFVTPDGRPRASGSWVAVPEHVFKELIG